MSATGQRAATALLTVGSLCTGYGSLDLAVMAVTGARLTWTAETDRHAVVVLAHHWPGVPNLGDITALDWATVPPVDLVTAGWPCQDISYDGAGADITEGTRSGLWLHIAGGLRHLQPCYVFLENVPAVRTRGLGRVLADLAAGMTRSGRAYALPMPERRTAATAFSSWRSGQGQRPGSRLLPTPVAGNYCDGAETEGWKARRDRQKKLGRNGNGIGTPLPVAIALLPTPMASDLGADKAFSPVRPSGVKRQTGAVRSGRLAVPVTGAGGHDRRSAPGRPSSPRARPGSAPWHARHQPGAADLTPHAESGVDTARSRAEGQPGQAAPASGGGARGGRPAPTAAARDPGSAPPGLQSAPRPAGPGARDGQRDSQLASAQ